MKKGISINLKGQVLMILIAALLTCLVCYFGSVYKFNKTHTKLDNTKTSNLSSVCKLEYDEIAELIIDNPWAHNSIFRGKDITNYYTDGSLYDRIAGTNGYNIFEDLYVGDYITATSGGQTTTWRIAGFDMYMNKGDGGDNVAPLTTHHAVIVPDTMLTSAKMNPLDENGTAYTTGGYVNSYMYTSFLGQDLTTIGTVLYTYIKPVFEGHILKYRNLLANSTSTTALYGRDTSVSSAYYPNNWIWQTRYLDLMNENQVSGSIEFSSTGYETGSDNIQFPLFRLKPEYIVSKDNSGNNRLYWLRNLMNSTQFSAIGNNGSGNIGGAAANALGGVRPYFYID